MELKLIYKIKDQEKETIIKIENSKTVLQLKERFISEFNLKIHNPKEIGIWAFEDSNTSKNLLKVPLSDNNKELKNYGIHNKMTIEGKNIGHQISWRLVYLIEYAGPIFSFIIFFLLLKKSNMTQKLGLLMSSVHYIKRFLESFYLHEFSSSTMPFANLFKNTAYYWGLYGIICGLSLFNNSFNESNLFGPFKYIFVLLFFYFEYKNYKAHLTLKRLKENNNGQRGIPYGEGFDYVSCANYMWEFFSWVSFSLFVNHPSFYVFTICGFYQMRLWAIKKHENLKSLFSNYPKERKAFIPYLI